MQASGPPSCSAVGRHCRGLSVTVRVATINGPASSADHEATWLLGHTEHIRFGPLTRRGSSIYSRAFLSVPCKFAAADGANVHCRAHGFGGRVSVDRGPALSRQLGPDRFQYVHRGRLVAGKLATKKPAKSGLPILGANPCATAPCRTADNKRGAACCRDLQVEILCPPRNTKLESLIRARKSPYLCKIDRDKPDSLGVEMISSCSYLAGDKITCTLHGRTRPDGRSAKPDLCFLWPEKGDVFHTGCVFR